MYLWDASRGSISELVTIDEDEGPVTSVSWALDRHKLAIGLNNSEVQLWDSAANRQVSTLKGVHQKLDSSNYSQLSARLLFQRRFLPRNSSKENLDRFIPNRPAIYFDFAHYTLTDGKGKGEHVSSFSPSREAYMKQLAEVLNLNRTCILPFRNKPQPRATLSFRDYYAFREQQPAVPRHIHIPQTLQRILDLLVLVDDFYLHLLYWGSANVVAIAVDRTVYL
ncbi:unnamed protein product [Thlaspi arvense]|uniref:Uncharacterized protein n=1 Tax=Thlaspi arvense TaxID=13288 RepID=A0AAU9SFV1_THLAR|nr:unnamed protein product [Thlaspi arvense]